MVLDHWTAGPPSRLSFTLSPFTGLQEMVSTADPLGRFALQEENQQEFQYNMMNFVSDFLRQFCELEKNCTAESTINKIGTRTRIAQQFLTMNSGINMEWPLHNSLLSSPFQFPCEWIIGLALNVFIFVNGKQIVSVVSLSVTNQ